MLLKRSILFFIMILPVFSCLAQNTRFQESGTGIEVTYGYGFIMPHHQMIEYFIEDHIHTLDIKINKATFGEQYWNQLFRYPSYGIGYYRSNLGNDEVFGKVNALYSFVKVPLLDTREKINIGWQIGVGVSYLTEHFDMEDNPQNLAIGSPLNIYIDLSLQSQIPLADKINLTNGIRFTHFSNGKVNSPNKGLNIISGSIGLLYNFYDSPEKYFQELPQIEKLNEYSIIYAGGIKSKSRYEPGSYYASSLIFDYSRNYSLKRKWIVGADLFYDETKKTYSQENQNNVFNTDLYQFGLHVGHEMMMGKLGFTLNVGGYLYMPVEEEAPLYSRIGLRYRFGKKFIANLTLKAHWAIASYIEWGIGYAF